MTGEEPYSLPDWPPPFYAGPFERDGTEVFPPDTPLDEAERVLRERLAQGHSIGLRDAAGRLVSVVPGRGVVVSEVIDVCGLTAAAVFASQHARLMALLWTIAADLAEARELTTTRRPRRER